MMLTYTIKIQLVDGGGGGFGCGLQLDEKGANQAL